MEQQRIVFAQPLGHSPVPKCAAASAKPVFAAVSGRGFLRLFCLLCAMLFSMPGHAAFFNWASSSCITGASCTSVGSITRFSGAVGGTTPRDILLEVVSVNNGASVSATGHFGTATGQAVGMGTYFSGELTGNSTASAISQVHFRLTFVTPGTSTPAPLLMPVKVSSMDTDGNGSDVIGGVRERIEFFGSPTISIIGNQLVPASSLEAGTAYHTTICTATDTAAVGCAGTGLYPSYDGISTTPSVMATAIYAGPVTSIEFAVGAEVSAAGIGSSGNIFRLYGIQAGIPDANLQSAISCSPDPAVATTAVTCTASCVNVGLDFAFNPSCDFTGTLPGGATKSASCGTSAVPLNGAGSINCGLTFTPSTAGIINLTAGAGAPNDTSGGTDPAAGDNPSAKALTVNPAPISDMSAVFSLIPTDIRPGQSLTGLKLTCTNAAGGASATAASCAATASAGSLANLSCPGAGTSVAAGSAISCTFDYTAPGAQGGANEPTASILFTGTTGATNDA
ncbi:MAG: hypothetical protein AB9M53_03555, partial [Leptothrix sp. (in: b-proteobacteria)]